MTRILHWPGTPNIHTTNLVNLAEPPPVPVQAFVTQAVDHYRAAGVPIFALELVEQHDGAETRWWVRIRPDVELTKSN
jgi:hypothetical protein